MAFRSLEQVFWITDFIYQINFLGNKTVWKMFGNCLANVSTACNCLATEWQLNCSNCLSTVWQLWQLFGNCGNYLANVAIVWQLIGKGLENMATVWQMWQLCGNCVATVWQIYGKYLANVASV